MNSCQQGRGDNGQEDQDDREYNRRGDSGGMNMAMMDNENFFMEIADDGFVLMVKGSIHALAVNVMAGACIGFMALLQ
jgi:hypothetical protein